MGYFPIDDGKIDTRVVPIYVQIFTDSDHVLDNKNIICWESESTTAIARKRRSEMLRRAREHCISLMTLCQAWGLKWADLEEFYIQNKYASLGDIFMDTNGNHAWYDELSSENEELKKLLEIPKTLTNMLLPS
jgi:hypothetical protein